MFNILSWPKGLIRYENSMKKTSDLENVMFLIWQKLYFNFERNL